MFFGQGELAERIPELWGATAQREHRQQAETYLRERGIALTEAGTERGTDAFVTGTTACVFLICAIAVNVNAVADQTTVIPGPDEVAANLFYSELIAEIAAIFATSCEG
jgi:hypothetical protein